MKINRRRLAAYRFLKSIKHPKLITFTLELHEDFDIQKWIEYAKNQPLNIIKEHGDN